MLVRGMAAVLTAAVTVGAPAAVAEREARQDGQVVVVAGTGEEGYSGDGHRATDARISDRGGISVGPDGTLYLADYWSGRVRAVNGDGIIETLPGARALRSPATDGPEVNGWQYSPSDRPSAVAAMSDGTLYVAGSETVRRLAPDGTSTHIADISGITYASDIAVDGAGNVYIGGSDQVVKIDPAGAITPFAGGGELDPFDANGKPATEARLSGHDIPIAVDPDGAVYVVVAAEQPLSASGTPTPPAVHRVDPDGTMHLVAGGRSVGFGGDGGPAVEAQLSATIGGLAVDPDGNLYIYDQGNRIVRVVDPEGTITSITPTLGADRVASAMDIGPDGDLYIRSLARVHRLVRDATNEEKPAGAANYPSPYDGDEPGTVHVVAGSGEEIAPAELPVPAEPVQPMRIAVGPDGSRYYSDTYQDRVMKVAADGSTSVFAGTGEAEFAGDGGKATDATLSGPSGLDVGPDGSVYIADTGNERVRKVDPSGVITTVAGNGTAGDAGGSFGEEVTVHGDGGPATAATVTPSDVAVADDGSLYIAEDDNMRISRVAPDGTISTVAGNGERWQEDADGHPAEEADFFHLLAIELGPDGRVYVLDDGVEFMRPAVRMIDPAGIMRTIAGSSYRSEEEAGFGGDGGPADLAELNNPRDLAVGPDGVLYIADAYNGRVRTVDPNGTIATFAGTGERADSGDDGPAAAAAVNEPQAVAVGADGTVSVIGLAGDRLREIKGGTITTVATLGQQEAAPPGDRPALETPILARSIAVDRDGGLIIAGPGAMSKVDKDGLFTQPFDQTELGGVQAMTATPDGTRYVAVNNAVYRMAGNTRGLPVAGGGPSENSEDRVDANEVATLASFGTVIDLAVSPGGRLYVATVQKVYRVTEDGTVEEVFKGASVSGIAVDAEERLYVASAEAHQLFGVTADGERTTVAGNGKSEVWDETSGEATEVSVAPTDVAVDGAGNVYLSSSDGIHRVDSDGTILRVADNPWVNSTRSAITGLAADRHGNLYYVDNTTDQVKVVVQPGEISAPFNWTLAIVIALVVLALAFAGWYFLWWRRNRTVATSADGGADEPVEDASPERATVEPATGGSAVEDSSDEPVAGEPAEVEPPDRSVVGKPEGGTADEEATPPPGK